MLKGALHTHTTKSDGMLTPLELLRVYRDLGFDFVALTDHDFLLRPGAYDGVPDEFEGMLVFKGVELTVFARGYLHVNRIAGKAEVLHVFNHPAEYGFSVPQLLERLEEVRRSVPIDALEITQKGFYTPEYDLPEIELPKVASDDAHTREACGRAWIEVPCGKDRDEILRAIKAGGARPCYRATATLTAHSTQ
ncbi:MAG: hypothetical protein HYV26_18315 [Candidatus Hydrogenedentes bacterium]|nr:hypothetical protein [Candidatus Hydrogenedentota bacterium]